MSWLILGLCAFASQSSTSINLTFIVPVVCEVVEDAPKCNLILTKIDSTTWVDTERGYRVTLDNGFITIEELK